MEFTREEQEKLEAIAGDVGPGKTEAYRAEIRARHQRSKSLADFIGRKMMAAAAAEAAKRAVRNNRKGRRIVRITRPKYYGPPTPPFPQAPTLEPGYITPCTPGAAAEHTRRQKKQRAKARRAARS